MIKKFFIAFAIFLCAGISSAQVIQLTSDPVFIISGTQTPEIAGDLIIAKADSQITTSRGASVTIKTDYKFRRVRARRNGERLDIPPLENDRLLFSKPGEYEVEVTVYDPERGIDDAQIAFTVEDIAPPPPDDPDKPDEPDKPDGKFDDLANRVSKISIQMSTPDRAKWANVLASVIAKMSLYDFKRIEDVQDFVLKADLATTPKENGMRLQALLRDDSAKRVLSWAQTIEWYKEIKRGIEQ